ERKTLRGRKHKSVNSTSSRADTARCRFPVHWSRPDSDRIVQLLPLSTEPNRSPLPTLSSPPATTSGSADRCSHSALAFILFTRSAPLLKSPTSPVGNGVIGGTTFAQHPRH